MAKLWGINTSNELKPIWLNDRQKERCYATSAGWVYKHLDGSEELLVVVKGLSAATKLANATITEVKFGSGAFTAGATRTVKVSFNERVTVSGGAPTLVIAGTTTPTTVATYASTNSAGNTLTFNFTVPVAGNTLSVGAQSLTLAGATITETGVTPTVNAALSIAADVATGAATKTTV